MSSRWIWAIALAACGNNNNNSPVDAHTTSHDATPIDAALDAFVPKDAPPGMTGFPLGSVGGIAYTANVIVGGTQPFVVTVDTGSTTMGIAGSTCGNCGVTPEYTPGAGAVDQHSTATSTYGDTTSWTGENFSDTVRITGDTDVTMRFSSMTTQTGFFRQGFPNQGILGFASALIALPGTDSYIAKRAAASLPSEFSFQFCPNDGTLWLGDPDPTHMAAAPQFTPMVPISGSQPFYEVDITSATIGATSIGLSGPGVADTGTSLMILSTAVANAMIAQIQANGFSTIFGTQTLSADPNNVDCLDPGTHTRAEIDAALPPFTITLPSAAGGSFTLSIPPSQSYLLPIDGAYCFGVASVDGLPTILGDAFLRRFVTIFDVDHTQIGLAPQTGCVLPPEVRPSGPVHAPHWFIRGHST